MTFLNNNNHKLCPNLKHTIHLHQQLVKCVLLLALPAKVAFAPLSSHCVNLIDKQNTWCILSSHVEHVSHLKRFSKRN